MPMEEPCVMEERPMMEERRMMPIGCVPAAHPATGHRHAMTTPHVPATPATHVAAHMTTTTAMAGSRGKRGQ